MARICTGSRRLIDVRFDLGVNVTEAANEKVMKTSSTHRCISHVGGGGGTLSNRLR